MWQRSKGKKLLNGPLAGFLVDLWLSSAPLNSHTGAPGGEAHRENYLHKRTRRGGGIPSLSHTDKRRRAHTIPSFKNWNAAHRGWCRGGGGFCSLLACDHGTPLPNFAGLFEEHEVLWVEGKKNRCPQKSQPPTSPSVRDVQGKDSAIWWLKWNSERRIRIPPLLWKPAG